MMRSYALNNENRQIFKLYWPVLIEQGLTMLIGIISTIMVSNVGDYAVSGVNLVDQINFMVISVFNALAAGATVVIAQSIGAGKTADAGKTANQSVVLCVFVSVILGIVSVGAARPILGLLYGNASKNVLDAGYTYFIFSGLSYPFVGVYAASAGIMRASGNSRSPMIASVIANIVNITAAMILISAAGLGVLGASIAMLLARIVSGALTFLAAQRSMEDGALKKFSLRFDRSVLKPVFRIGVPSGIDSFIFQGARIFMSVLLSDMGTVSMHANTIAGSLLGIINLPGNAFQITSVTVVGQAYGARLFKSAKKLMFRMCNFSSIAQTLLFIPFFILMDALIGLYGPAEETASLVRRILFYSFVFTPFFWSFSFVMPQTLRSVGDAKPTMYISVASLFFLRIAGSWFFGKYMGWGVIGVWTAMFLDWIGRSAGFLIRASFNMWNRGLVPVDEGFGQTAGQSVGGQEEI